METLHQLLVNRRSIRRYTAQPIDADQVKLILEAALLAPTSKSSRSWRFVVVEDESTLQKLSECKEVAAGPIARCKLAIVVAGDPEKSEAWKEDCSIAAAYMQLQAADLGLGSCWIQVHGRYRKDGMPASDYVQETLGIPNHFPVLCVITLGHPDEQRRPQDTEKLLWERVHIGKWNPDVEPEL